MNFDGLVPPPCLLLEAKDSHDNWFAEDWSPGGGPSLRDDFVERVLMPQILAEAASQLAVVRPLYPEVKLKWVFSSQVFKIWFTEWLIVAGNVIYIQTEWMP